MGPESESKTALWHGVETGALPVGPTILWRDSHWCGNFICLFVLDGESARCWHCLENRWNLYGFGFRVFPHPPFLDSLVDKRTTTASKTDDAQEWAWGAIPQLSAIDIYVIVLYYGVDNWLGVSIRWKRIGAVRHRSRIPVTPPFHGRSVKLERYTSLLNWPPGNGWSGFDFHTFRQK